LAILYIKKIVAIDNSQGKFLSSKFRVIQYFIEADLGVNSNKDSLSSFFIDEIRFRTSDGRNPKLLGSARNMIEHSDNLKKIIQGSHHFEYTLANFLDNELGKAWVKSLRYDALVE
jgi:hypothetical protein